MMMPSIRQLVASAVMVAGPLLLLPTPAVAGVYVTETAEGVTLRCNTIRTGKLPEQALERYGVTEEEDLGLLSCVMQRQTDAGYENLDGRMAVRITTLTGIVQDPPFRQVLDNQQIGFITTYDIPVTGPLQFEVSAAPEDGTPELTISFDDIRPRE